MHCSNYGKVGHNKPRCPDPPKPAPPKSNKRGRKKNPTEEKQEIAAEMETEEKAEIGEAELMEEALDEMEPPQPSTPRRNQRIAKGTQNTLETATPASAVFMPNPGMKVHVGTGGTPPADNPGTSRKKKAKGPVKGFTAPRKK